MEFFRYLIPFSRYCVLSDLCDVIRIEPRWCHRDIFELGTLKVVYNRQFAIGITFLSLMVFKESRDKDVCAAVPGLSPVGAVSRCFCTDPLGPCNLYNISFEL